MFIKNYIPILTSIDLFKYFSSEELLKYFSENSYYVSSYKKYSIVHFESEKCLTLDIIVKGEVTIQRIDENGNVLTITDFKTGSNIGGNLLFSKHPYYPMTITAKSDTEILHINKDLVLMLCQSNMHFLNEYLGCISDKTAILTNKIKNISLKSIRGSIIDFLKYEYFFQNSYNIQLRMTKKELAEKLGIQRTSLSRELNKMRNDRLIEFDAHTITIICKDIIK